MEEVQEDLASVSSAPVDLLSRLLGEVAHDPPHPEERTDRTLESHSPQSAWRKSLHFIL